MTYKQAIRHYGSASALAKHFGWSIQRVSNWKRKNAIPEAAQLHIEKDTGGKLKAKA